MTAIPWADPWYSIEDQQELQGRLDAELQEELPAGHVLAGRGARAIGRRRDTDDVLYCLDEEQAHYAVVHLTWQTGQERDPAFPAAQVFRGVADVVAKCIGPDAAEHGEKQHE